MSHRSLVVGVVVALLTCAGARAEPSRVQPAALEYGFDDEVVQGGLREQNTEVLIVRGRGVRQSLVHVRTSYVRELLESVEDL